MPCFICISEAYPIALKVKNLDGEETNTAQFKFKISSREITKLLNDNNIKKTESTEYVAMLHAYFQHINFMK